jgi:hypothetical protein
METNIGGGLGHCGLSDWNLSTAAASGVQGLTGRTGHPLIAKQWKHLWPREVVELRRGGTVLGTGWVDEATADGTTIWIHLTRGLGRVLIHAHDGIDLWRVDSGVHRGVRQNIPEGARQDG